MPHQTVKQKTWVRPLEQRAQDTKYPEIKRLMLSEAEEVAALIYDSLGIKELGVGGHFQFNALWRLCQEHGCEPYVSPVLMRKAGGLWVDFNGDVSEFGDGGQIMLSAHMTFAESCAVMLHELAHRVLYSPRFSDWALEGSRRYRNYDPREWQEAVARAVERLFLKAGGTGLLPPRFYRSR